MSQKKLKKLRKEEYIILGKSNPEEKLAGIREIIKNNWKFLVLLCLGIIVLYFNAMKGNFVSDDYATIPNNPEIMSFGSGLKGWFAGIINWFLAVTFGVVSPIPFHITSLLFYLLLLIAAFVFVSLILNNNLVSRISLVIFAVLPIHVETVSWIAGRPYLINALFVLFSLSLFILYSRSKNKKYLYSFLFFTVLTFFTEPTRSMALPLLILLYWFSFDNVLKKKLNIWKILIACGGLFLVFVVFLWPKLINRIESVNSGVNTSDSIFYDPFFQYPTAITKYLQLIVVPVDLTLYHTMYTIPVWLNWLIFLTYLTSLVWFWFKNKKIFFSLAFIFVATAPSMAPVKISWLVAERYVFLGSLGMIMVIGFFVGKIWNYKKIISIVLLSILTSVYMVRVYLRNIDWQTNHNLWVNTCQVSPNSHNAWNNIGDDYDKLKDYDNSIKGFGQSYAIKPNYADAYHNQANIFYKIGRLDLARNAYETALKYNPNLFQTYLTLLQLDISQKNETELLSHLAIIQKIKPNDLQVAYITAMAYAQIGKTNEAKQLAEIMYKQFPNVAEIKNLYDSLNIPSKN